MDSISYGGLYESIAGSILNLAKNNSPSMENMYSTMLFPHSNDSTAAVNTTGTSVKVYKICWACSQLNNDLFI